MIESLLKRSMSQARIEIEDRIPLHQQNCRMHDKFHFQVIVILGEPTEENNH